MTPLQADVWSILTDVSLGTWLGFLVTIATSLIVLYVRHERKKTNLRRSLIAELEQQDLDRVVSAVTASEAAVPPGEANENPDLDPSELPPAGTLPTQIYTSGMNSVRARKASSAHTHILLSAVALATVAVTAHRVGKPSLMRSPSRVI